MHWTSTSSGIRSVEVQIHQKRTRICEQELLCCWICGTSVSSTKTHTSISSEDLSLLLSEVLLRIRLRFANGKSVSCSIVFIYNLNKVRYAAVKFDSAVSHDEWIIITNFSITLLWHGSRGKKNAKKAFLNRWFATNLLKHRQQWWNVQMLVDEQKELMRKLLFLSTNMAAMA